MGFFGFVLNGFEGPFESCFVGRCGSLGLYTMFPRLFQGFGAGITDFHVFLRCLPISPYHFQVARPQNFPGGPPMESKIESESSTT